MRGLFGRKKPPQHRATLITCQKDEGAFLIEWLAYHKAIGFDRVIVGANDCSDGSHEMLTRLAELGEVEYIPFKRPATGIGAQFAFAQILHAAKIIPYGAWVCWLDLDEFLNIHLGSGHLDDLRTAMAGADGIRMNWRMFGAEADPRWPGRQLHPDLCRCAPADLILGKNHLDQRTIKSFYRFERFLKVNVHGATHSILNDLTFPVWLNGSGKRIRDRRKLRKIHVWAWARTPSRVYARPAYDWAQINHYFIRHPSLVPLRQQRGRGSIYVPPVNRAPGFDDFSERHSASYFARYNRTDAEDKSILRHIPATDAEMARLLADPIVRQWHDHAQQRVADFLAAAI